MRDMGMWFGALALVTLGCASSSTASSEGRPLGQSSKASKQLYMDVHELGQVSFKDVAAAHQKDLATQAKYGVEYKAYWVDEAKGTVYCLVEAPSAEAANDVHREAHGLVAARIAEVTAATTTWSVAPGAKLFMDVHRLGKGNVTPEALAAAHAKDVAVEDKYGVKFLNYWLDEETGTVMCLAQAPSAEAAIAVHKEAHGLLPDTIVEVIEGR